MFLRVSVLVLQSNNLNGTIKVLNPAHVSATFKMSVSRSFLFHVRICFKAGRLRVVNKFREAFLRVYL